MGDKHVSFEGVKPDDDIPISHTKQQAAEALHEMRTLKGYLRVQAEIRKAVTKGAGRRHMLDYLGVSVNSGTDIELSKHLGVMLQRSTPSDDFVDGIFTNRPEVSRVHAELGGGGRLLLYGPSGAGKLTCVFQVCKTLDLFPWVLTVQDLLDPGTRRALQWIAKNDKRAVLVIRDAHNLTDESVMVLTLELVDRRVVVGIASTASEKGCSTRSYFTSTLAWPAVRDEESRVVVDALVKSYFRADPEHYSPATVAVVRQLAIAATDLTIADIVNTARIAQKNTASQISPAGPPCGYESSGSTDVLWNLALAKKKPSVNGAEIDYVQLVDFMRERSNTKASDYLKYVILLAWLTAMLHSTVDATDFACYT